MDPMNLYSILTSLKFIYSQYYRNYNIEIRHCLILLLFNQIAQVKLKTFNYDDLLLETGNGADEKTLFSK